MLAAGMLAWVVRYSLFALGAPDLVNWVNIELTPTGTDTLVQFDKTGKIEAFFVEDTGPHRRQLRQSAAVLQQVARGGSHAQIETRFEGRRD